MIQHLPPKGFRMVRYYGIYARPVREKIHALVATVLKNLVDCARKVAQYFALKNGKPAQARPGKADEYQKKADERFGKGDVCCPNCGLKMTLILIWSKARGIVYDLFKDGLSNACPSLARENNQNADKNIVSVVPVMQLVFAF